MLQPEDIISEPMLSAPMSPAEYLHTLRTVPYSQTEGMRTENMHTLLVAMDRGEQATRELLPICTLATMDDISRLMQTSTLDIYKIRTTGMHMEMRRHILQHNLIPLIIRFRELERIEEMVNNLQNGFSNGVSPQVQEVTDTSGVLRRPMVEIAPETFGYLSEDTFVQNIYNVIKNELSDIVTYCHPNASNTQKSNALKDILIQAENMARILVTRLTNEEITINGRKRKIVRANNSTVPEPKPRHAEPARIRSGASEFTATLSTGF